MYRHKNLLQTLLLDGASVKSLSIIALATVTSFASVVIISVSRAALTTSLFTSSATCIIPSQISIWYLGVLLSHIVSSFCCFDTLFTVIIAFVGPSGAQVFREAEFFFGVLEECRVLQGYSWPSAPLLRFIPVIIGAIASNLLRATSMSMWSPRSMLERPCLFGG